MLLFMMRGQGTSLGIVITIRKPFLSEDAHDRPKMGKDAKQLTRKLTGSAVMVWKRFNKLETISKMVDGSDADQTKACIVKAEHVFFFADQIYGQEAGNRRQTQEQSPLFL